MIAKLFGLEVDTPTQPQYTAQQQVVLDALNAMGDKEWIFGKDGGHDCYNTVAGVKNPGGFVDALNSHTGAEIRPINISDAVVTIPLDQLGVEHVDAIKGFKVGSSLDKRDLFDFQNSSIIFD